jgi:hypothetical protein
MALREIQNELEGKIANADMAKAVIKEVRSEGR